ncbi:MAG: DNA/RNA non-specific endonuclease [Microscillaceae bacterium]|nr:DNA/RNA non-specific endonuclease [Microscillaceae bacterium]
MNLSPLARNFLRSMLVVGIGGAIMLAFFPDYFKKQKYLPQHRQTLTNHRNTESNPTQTTESKSSQNSSPQTGAGQEPWLPAHNPQDKMLIRHQYYTLLYSEEHEQALWVAYKLESYQTKGNTRRQDDFRPDPKVVSGSATPADYRGSGYSRGHLAPVADFRFDPQAMNETFFMSNMSPQTHQMNAGIWNDLEQQVRYWVGRDKQFYIVSGPILKQGLPKIGRENRVSVPEQYYKIIVDVLEPELKAIAFLIPNRDSSEPFQKFAVSIDELEKLTGIDFFPQLPDDLEESLESQVKLDQWFNARNRFKR